MRQLSSLDAQFLAVETPTTTAHVAALVTLEPGEGGELGLDDLRDLVESRLHLVPTLGERVVEVPLGLGSPFWVRDEHFDLEFHTREVALPAPGSPEQLAEQVARLHALPLDRSRPLWEMYLVHGVVGADGRRRQALYAKVHHAAVDGVAGMEVLRTVLDDTPSPRAVTPPADVEGGSPSAAALLVRGLASTVVRTAQVATRLPRAVPRLGDIPVVRDLPGARLVGSLAADLVEQVTGRAIEPWDGRTLLPPPTPFNAPVTAHRRVAVGSVALADVRAVGESYGLGVNDVVLAMTATALRRWLLDRDRLPVEPLVVAVPVSLRSAVGPDPATGNEVSLMLMRLPTQVADPLERLLAVGAAAAEAQAAYDTVPTTAVADLSAMVPTAASGAAARALVRLASGRARPFNLFVSNVAGPPTALYVAGARVTGLFPLSGVSDATGGLNVTVFSHDGQLSFGLVSCRETVPDLSRLLGLLTDALAELAELAEPDDD